MARDNYPLWPSAYSTAATRMAAMRASARAQAIPDENRAGEKQQPEHDVAKIPVAQRVIEPRAEPASDDRGRKGKQRKPQYLARDQAACRLHAQRRKQHGVLKV